MHMDNERNQIIQNGVKAKKQKSDIRKELIGAGYRTGDFDELYASTLTELGFQEPVPPKVTVGTKTYIPPEFGGTQVTLPHANSGTNYVKGALIGVICIALVASAFFFGSQLLDTSTNISNEPLKWGKERVQEKEEDVGLSFGDEVLQTKVKATVASAMIQGGRMGSYDGVCKDISVVAPIVCKQTENSFMMYVPMSNGTYFCEDEKQQGSIVPLSPAQKMSCR
jgi:hypothetical protein